jgi:pimeloyl-ACP methyl ester carboxylesterase
MKTQTALVVLAAATHRAAGRAVRRARAESVGGIGETRPSPPRRQHLVRAADGTGLAAYEWGDPEAPVSVVLSHGWTLSSRLWSRQITVLSRHARVIAYDHRGHGGSDRSTPASCTVRQLGADLAAVIDTLAPQGRIVLAGHSMGGMTLMHLAEQRPDLIADRVDGVVIVSSSAGDLSSSDFGFPGLLGSLVRRLGPHTMAGLSRLESWAERRGSLAPEMWLAARALTFGPGAPAHLVDEMLGVIKDVPLGVVSAFYAGLALHDGRAGLRVLDHAPTTILAGTEDRLTPLSHSLRIADAMPNAELVTFDGAGHMLTLERPMEVAQAIAGYIGPGTRATRAGDLVVAR